LYNSLIEVDKQIVISIGYIGKEIADYSLMEKKMLKLLAQLNTEVLK